MKASNLFLSLLVLLALAAPASAWHKDSDRRVTVCGCMFKSGFPTCGSGPKPSEGGCAKPSWAGSCDNHPGYPTCTEFVPPASQPAPRSPRDLGRSERTYY